MKHFSTPSIDRTFRASFMAVAMCLVLLLTFSCASEPSVTQGASDEAESASLRDAVASTPTAGFSYQKPPLPVSPETVLAEPLPPLAIVIAQKEIPSDITVLSTVPRSDPLSLPEPSVPLVAKVIPPPVTKPVVKPVAKAETKPAATPETKIDTEKPSEPKPDTSQADIKPALILPATPASSARSITAAQAQPVAETRLETVRGQRFDLRFPGTGWIYLGDEEGKEGLKYETRRFEDSQAVFAMNPESPGEYLLRFQRQNPVDRSTEVSLVRVIVSDKVAAATAPASQAATQSKQAESVVLPPQTAAAVTPAASTVAPDSQTPSVLPSEPVVLPTEPAALIRFARNELEASRVQSAIAVLDRYLSLYPYGNDEIYYLYGLAYEQDTPFRNIKKSYEYYKRVRDDYPRSLRWREAADRVAYLERHYFGLR